MKITTLALLISTAALAATGSIPKGMPTNLGIGLFEDTGKTWMKTSRVPFQLRYRYLTYRWSDNWGFGAKDGSFAGQYFRDSDTQGFIPVIAYYEIYDLPPANTGQLAKMQNSSAMLEYFNDFKLLMQQAKTFGKPVLVMVEPDATGFLQQSSGDPNTPCAVAATGMPELVSLPNTSAGWGMAFLQIRKLVGADNVILGMHVSGWATGSDLFHSAVTLPLQPEVDKVASFLGPLGLANNVTGQTYDVVIVDPLDRDADYYRIVRSEDRWWTPTGTLDSKSFPRYAEWLRLWNVKVNKRIVVWQIPIGNASSLNVCNRGLTNQGYKDNRVDYFFGSLGAGHRKLFVDNGVIALLFGAGESCQTTQETDGNLLKNTVAAYFTGGELSLPVAFIDAGMPVVDAGAPTIDSGFVCPICPVCPAIDAGIADAGRPDAGVDAGIDAGVPTVDAGSGSMDFAQYNFENSTHGFTSSGTATSIGVSTVNIFAGKNSLGLIMNNSSGTVTASVKDPVIPRGATVTFHVFIPVGAPVASLQVFAQETAATSWKWIASWVPATGIQFGKYNTFTLTMPTVPGVLQGLGVEFALSGPYTGMFNIDSIYWDAGPAVDAGTPPPTPVIDAGTPSVPDAGVPPVTGGVRLMPLGDSITAEDHAWRCELARLLRAKGMIVSLVGTSTSQYDECPYHDGHPGFTISDISGQVNSWLTASKPDIVVLLAGTNDVAWWTAENGTQIADRLNALITKIQTSAPGVKIVVQTLPPQSSAIIAPNNVNRQVLVQQFNDRLKTLIAARIALAQPVRLADTNAALTLSDLRDGIHPTPQAGIAKIAPTVYNAILSF